MRLDACRPFAGRLVRRPRPAEKGFSSKDLAGPHRAVQILDRVSVLALMVSVSDRLPCIAP